MAYDRDEIFQQAQAAIRDHNLFFIEDVVAFIPISKQTTVLRTITFFRTINPHLLVYALTLHTYVRRDRSTGAVDDHSHERIDRFR